jgi:N-methylhydantoinase A
MSHALRQVSVRRGYDPRNYQLLACGGVGPLIAVALASEAGIRDVLVPPAPGVFSAFGLAVADLRIDYVSAEGGLDVRRLTSDDVTRRLHNLNAKARQEFASLGYDNSKLKLFFAVDARYYGQGYELRVPVTAEMIALDGPASIETAFDSLHQRQYGLSRPGNRIDIVSFRLNATLPRENGSVHRKPEATKSAIGRRSVTFFGRAAEYTVANRSSIVEGDQLAGPAIIVEETSSTIVPLNWTAWTDQAGNLRLRDEARAF